MKQIWNDTDFTLTGTYRPVRITVDGKEIYKGVLSAYPNEDEVNMLINKVCEPFLEIDYPANTGVTSHPKAYRVFRVEDWDGNLLGTQDFIYDWSYEVWKPVMSKPVNGHLDCRMRMPFSMWRSIGGNIDVNIDHLCPGDAYCNFDYCGGDYCGHDCASDCVNDVCGVDCDSDQCDGEFCSANYCGIDGCSEDLCGANTCNGDQNGCNFDYCASNECSVDYCTNNYCGSDDCTVDYCTVFCTADSYCYNDSEPVCMLDGIPDTGSTFEGVIYIDGTGKYVSRNKYVYGYLWAPLQAVVTITGNEHIWTDEYHSQILGDTPNLPLGESAFITVETVSGTSTARLVVGVTDSGDTFMNIYKEYSVETNASYIKVSNGDTLSASFDNGDGDTLTGDNVGIHCQQVMPFAAIDTPSYGYISSNTLYSKIPHNYFWISDVAVGGAQVVLSSVTFFNRIDGIKYSFTNSVSSRDNHLRSITLPTTTERFLSFSPVAEPGTGGVGTGVKYETRDGFADGREYSKTITLHLSNGNLSY